MQKLNSKQLKFCQEYVIDNNGTQAAIRAAYSSKTADVIASKLLGKVKVQAEIQCLQANIAKQLEIDSENIAMEFKNIAFSNIVDYLNDDLTVKEISMLPRHQVAAIKSIKIRKVGNAVYTEIKLFDKLRALDALGKHLGMFSEHRVQEEKPTLDLSKLTEEERSQIARLLMKAA